MRTKKLIPFLVVGAIVLAVIVVLWVFGGGGSLSGPDDGRGVEGEPMDITLDFYERWLLSVQATSSDPFADGLHNSQELSQNLSDKLSEYNENDPDSELDPVLCQTEAPTGLRTLPIFEQEESAKYLVMASERGKSGQAVVTVEKTGKVWRLVDITCGSAETDPNQGEFSFDRQGQLLKNVPLPLDSSYWHLVFEEDGVMGHTAPLIIDGSSICVRDGNESVCDTSQFEEATSVAVKGQMSETGVNVVRIEF